MSGREAGSAAALIRDMFRAALAVVDPMTATRDHLSIRDGALHVGDAPVPLRGRLLVVGMGKAAVPMALGAEAALGDRIAGGIVVTNEAPATKAVPRRLRVLEASHPVPDQRSLDAGQVLLDLVRSVGPDDIVVALISGGGSALAEALAPPLTLADLTTVTMALLRSGATIHELNAVRQAISLIKAGGLLRSSRATVVPVVLSDVIGNDPRIIASGAVVPGAPPTDRAGAALAVLDRYGLRATMPSAVTAHLDRMRAQSTGAETPPCNTIPPVIIGDNRLLVSAAAAWAEQRGLRIARPPEWQDRTGEAADLGAGFVSACRALPEEWDGLIGGGEATVTVRGDGAGGRNTEFALAAALALAGVGESGWVVASLATDGQDAGTGAAGAIADGQTVADAARRGIDAGAALDRNDSLAVFRGNRHVVVTGSTGTNVNDLYIGIRQRPAIMPDGSRTSATGGTT